MKTNKKTIAGLFALLTLFLGVLEVFTNVYGNQIRDYIGKYYTPMVNWIIHIVFLISLIVTITYFMVNRTIEKTQTERQEKISKALLLLFTMILMDVKIEDIDVRELLKANKIKLSDIKDFLPKEYYIRLKQAYHLEKGSPIIVDLIKGAISHGVKNIKQKTNTENTDELNTDK